MSAFISRILVFFYVIFLPLYVGLYITAHVSSYPKPAALWIEGGASEFGPAAFIVLLLLWCVPLLLSFAKYLLAGDSIEFGKVLIICAILFAHPVLGAIQAHPWEKGFPLQVLLVDWDKGVFAVIVTFGFLIILPFAGIGSLVYEIYELAEAKDQERKYFAELSARCRVNAREVSQLMAGLVAHDKRLNAPYSYGRKSAAEISRQYLPRHLTLLVKSGLPVDDYLSFAAKAVGERNMFNDDETAFSEIERHVRSFSEAGGVDEHFKWLEAMVRHEFKDVTFELFFQRTYGHKGEISLSQALVEFRVGEFTSPDEYLEFVKATVPYSAYDEVTESYLKGLAKMSHPVLVKMFKLGGAYRARALQVVHRAQNAGGMNKPKSTFTNPGASVVPDLPQASPLDLVMISRGGQIILRDVRLQNMSTMVMHGQVLMTDYYWCSGMAAWSPVSAYRNAEAPRQIPEEEVKWGDILADFFLSWLLYVLGGVSIAGLIGYGNGGMSGAGSAIAGFLGLIILVRPVTFLFRTLFRLAIGKRGMELFR